MGAGKRLPPFLLLLALSLLLAGCSTGNAEDARRAEQADATRGARLPGYEASQIREQFFASPSPVPPTRTPLPVLAELQLATTVGANGQPQDDVKAVRGSGTLYACARISNLRSGQTVTAIWRDNNGNQVGQGSFTVGADSDIAWVALPWEVPPGLASGKYAVFLYVNDLMLNSLVFRIA